MTDAGRVLVETTYLGTARQLPCDCCTGYGLPRGKQRLRLACMRNQYVLAECPQCRGTGESDLRFLFVPAVVPTLIARQLPDLRSLLVPG